MFNYILSVIVFLILLSILFNPPEKDSTDPIDGGRSGMALHTDAMTGCQYLSTPLGGIVERKNKDGQQVCITVE